MLIRLNKILKILLIIIFTFNIFLTQTARANQQIEQEKFQTEQELEKLKSDREVYESQISNLEDQFFALDNQLRETLAQQERINKNFASLNQKISRLKKITPKLLAQRKQLAAELYMILDDKLFFLTYFISADHFFNLLEGKDETQIIIEEKMRKLNLIDQVLILIGKREKLYNKQIADLRDQQQELAGRMVLLTVELKKHQDSLEKIDMRTFNLQQYLLSLGKINTLLERDFVGWNLADGENIVFIGGGTEHGIGMSQYGARGLANLGKGYQEILGHYYQNTHLANRNTSQINIRVGVVLGGSSGQICVRGGTAVQFKTQNAKVKREIIKKDQCVNVTGELTLNPTSVLTFFEVTYKLSGYNQYYGSIQVKNIGGSLFTINQLNLEQYLKGVVPAEMPRTWPLEALKAQAVAARSYAMRNIKPAAAFDVDDSTRYQVYLGKKHQSAATDRAVAETAGQVVMYGSEIIPAYYHSTSGGYTENNENVWGGASRSYLRGVPSPWEEDSPWWSWSSKIFSRTELSQILAQDSRTNVGLLQKIEIVNRGISGRVIAIKLTGSTGQALITGQTLRQIINNNLGVADPPLRSILFGVRNQ